MSTQSERPKDPRVRQERRLRRQIDAITGSVPWARNTVDRLTDNRMRLLRVPLAGILIMGGFLGFLPVLGFWMAPLGLLLLAIDLPALQPSVSSAMIRGRRRLRGWWRRKRQAD